MYSRITAELTTDLMYEWTKHVPERSLASASPVEGHDHLHHQRIA